MKIVEVKTVVDAMELATILEAAAIVHEVVEIEQWSDEKGTALYLVIVPYSVIKYQIKKERRKANEQKKKG